MKKKWALLVASVSVTVLLSLGLVRFIAPRLLGIPVDLQMVQVSEKVPPFFDGVFRESDRESAEFILNDPYLARNKPFYPAVEGLGPHDLIGFRNRRIPHVADIITIGDSQTYGNNAVLEENWPSQMMRHLGDKRLIHYSMAVGAWGAIDYWEIFQKALFFEPRVIIVAFYTGNDPLDSFRKAYAADRWSDLRPNAALSASDAPAVVFPTPPSDWWRVAFSDGASTMFTPGLRLFSNSDHPAVRAGYQIMAEVARRMVEKGKTRGIKTVFTIIPTKEFVYSDKIRNKGIASPARYEDIIRMEGQNIRKLSSELTNIADAVYVDVVAPLRMAALGLNLLYPENINGHPTAEGYSVIGKALAAGMQEILPKRPLGLNALMIDEKQYQLAAVGWKKYWVFASRREMVGNRTRFQEFPVVMLRVWLMAGLCRKLILNVLAWMR